jgi:hypothetical protein
MRTALLVMALLMGQVAPTPTAGQRAVYRGLDGNLHCLASDGTDCAVSVSAVQEPAKSWMESKGGDSFGCSNDGEMVGEVFEHQCKNGKRWTCGDKTRVLLTAEDGTRHCVKF